MSDVSIGLQMHDNPGYWGQANLKFRGLVSANQLTFVKSMGVISRTPISKLLDKYECLSYESREGDDAIMIFKDGDAYIWANHNGEDDSWSLMVAAKTMEQVDSRIKALKKMMRPVIAKVGTSPVKFWGDGEHGPVCTTRWLDVPGFEKIDGNYSSNTSKKLKELINSELPESGGKLILLHGVPGTGKTYAIRALINDWGDRCTTHYILDPERFFDKASYMNAVLLGDNDAPPRAVSKHGKPLEEEENGAWKLIILEDAGELLAKDAKTRTGQGFARLLNITNGLIGQGLRVLILITTNEPIEAVHEAVAREGRCLANIYFGPLSADEANNWLCKKSSSIKVEGDMTIADLYSIIMKRRKITNIPSRKKAGFLEA
jgi:hypothetical protein